MSKLQFSKEYTVNTFETDTNGNLAINGIFNYFQEVAYMHASILNFGKDDLEQLNRFWVLSRVYVKIYRIPAWEEKMIVKTWPRGVNRMFAIRDYEILNDNGEKYIGASSSWVIVNKENRRPIRPDKDLFPLNNNAVEFPLEKIAGKIEEAKGKTYTTQVFQVKYSDLDINMHVNNATYIKWVLDTYPLDHRINRLVDSIEVNFIAESLPGDELRVKVSETGENDYIHTVIRNNDKSDLCRVRVRWKN